MNIGTIITIIAALAIIAAIILTRRKNETEHSVPSDYDDIKQKLAVKVSEVEAKVKEITALNEKINKFTNDEKILIAENSSLKTSYDAALQQKNEASEAKNQADKQKDEKQNEIIKLKEQINSIRGELSVSEEKLKSQKSEIEAMQERMKIDFENIANKIMKENTDNFNKSSKEKLSDILKPFDEKLGEFKKKVEETSEKGNENRTALETLIKSLRDQTNKVSEEANNLALALKGDSKIQGDWGELQLEVLLEKLGFEEDVHYRKQANFKDENNSNVRPDFVINLPENRHCIIDCKVSLTAYERFFKAEDEIEKERALKEHISSVNRHIKELSDKKYEQLNGINSPDFVFMFVPIEAALMLAIQNDPTLVEDAVKKNVMLVSTSTLLFALRTVAYIWKVDKQNKNVQEIAKVGGELYDKFVGFAKNMTSVGNQITAAQNSYEDAMRQLTKKNTDGSQNAGTIIGKLESMKKLGASAAKQIDPVLLEKIEV